MLDGLHQVRGSDTALLFVLQFYSEPSQYFQTDDTGHTHVIHQGEGGEQGDALMPMLYALGQHGTLVCLQDFLLPHEHLFAYLDDLYVVCLPARVGPIFKHCKRHWISMPAYKSTWENPRCPFCQEMQEVAAHVDPLARVWRGQGPPSEQGVRVLGIPIGHKEFVQAVLRATTEKHKLLIERIPLVRISKVLGCSSSNAPTLARHIPFVVFHQLRQSSLQPLTIQPRCSVSPNFRGSLMM